MRYFLYNFKIILRNRDGLVFWVVAFPFILATLFYFAFSNLGNSMSFSTMNIAIVKDDSIGYQIYDPILKELEDEDSDQKIFNITTTDNFSDAENLLNSGDVTGIISFEENEPKITVKQNGTEQTIIKNILVTISDQIKLGGQTGSVKISNTYNTDLDLMIVEYISALAMACLYCSMMTAFVTGNNLPYTTMRGRRLAVSPTSKFKMLTTGFIVCAVIQLISISALFLYLLVILGINFGDHLWLVFLSLVVGSLAGLGLGVFVSSVFRCGERKKSAIIMIYTMVGCFLAGMMNPVIKYLVDANCGIVNKFNAAALIVDGIYSAAQYGNIARYWENLAILSVFVIIFIATSVIVMRRQKYDSL